MIAAPFTGGASAALIGGLGGAISGGGIKGALKGAALGSIGSAVAGGLGGAGAGKGIGGFFGRAKEFILPGTDKVGLFGNIGKGIGSLFGTPGTMPVRDPVTGQILNVPATGGGFLTNLISGGGGAGGGGGFGGLARNLGIGGLALGLGKLAFKDAQRQQGVPLTPLTTMSPTGRYNIEAEIARRMGQPAPNPVEFGLLPATTFPELSGAKPVMASLGGAIEELEGGMAQGMQEGGGIMAFAQGGAVAMQKGGEMDPSNFPPMDGDINGPGTEQSDDIPAMLSDGEFVMTARAVRGAGSYEMQTEPGGIINLIPSLEEDRERGMDVMYKVMDTFSGQAKPS